MSDQKKDFSSFLDNILRSAEGLEQGRKNDSFSSIELDQISNFFMRIASNCKKSNEGSDLLAKQGIDTEYTDRNLNKLIKQKDKNKLKGSENNTKNSQEYNPSLSYRFTNAIEKCEIMMYEEIDQNWGSIKSIQFVKWPRSIFESNDPSIRSTQALDAESFANAMRKILEDKKVGYKIFLPIVDVMVKWRDKYFGHDEFQPQNIVSDYITALFYITKTRKDPLEKEIYLNFNDMLEYNKSDPKLHKEQTYINTKLLHMNAKLYLEHRYRYFKYARTSKNHTELKMIMDYSDDDNQKNNNINELKKLFATNVPRDIMWENIWSLIQAGFSNLINLEMISKDKNTDDKTDYKTSYTNLSSLIALFKNPEKTIPNQNDSKEANKCFIFASKDSYYDIGELLESDELLEFQNKLDGEGLQTTVLFCQILDNIKKLANTPNNNDNLILDIMDGNANLLSYFNDYEQFDDENENLLSYFIPIYDILLFNFEDFVNDIIKICIFENDCTDYEKTIITRLPVITAHLCLIFYNIGKFRNPYLKVIINDLISLLPLPKYKDVALGYIALTRGEADKEDAIKFLLSLNLDEMELEDLFNADMYKFKDKEMFININDLLLDLYYEKTYEAKTIKLLAMFKEFLDRSLECFIDCIYKNHNKDDDNEDDENIINNLNSIDLPDVSILLEVSRILIEHFVLYQKSNIEKISKLLNLSIRCTLHALASSDAYNLTERIKMVKRAEKIYKAINDIEKEIKEQSKIKYFDSIFPMIQIAKILTAFETCKSDEAMRIAFQTKILPFNRQQLNEVSGFLDVPGLKESSAIGAAVEIIVMHLSKTILQYDTDTNGLRTILDFCKYLTLKEEVLSNIIQIRIRFSLF